MAILSRRIFLRASGIAAVAPMAGQALAQPAAPAMQMPMGHNMHPHGGAADGATGNGDAVTYMFFNDDEADFIEAAVERLIPPDEVGPSALEAGVTSFIDKQLTGAWGTGERLYRSGPWQPGTAMQGYQLPFTPAELFRTAMRGIKEDLERSRSTTFDKLDGAAQDAYLTMLQTSSHDLGGVPGDVFFASLHEMTIEGYFSDPVYGGNFGMAAWKMIGFPGAYAAYYDLVDQHGVQFKGEPRSLAENGRGAIRIMPAIPAEARQSARGSTMAPSADTAPRK